MIYFFIKRCKHFHIFKFAAGLKYSFHWFNSNLQAFSLIKIIQEQRRVLFNIRQRACIQGEINQCTWSEQKRCLTSFANFPNVLFFWNHKWFKIWFMYIYVFFFLIQKNKGIHIILSKHQNSHFSLFCLSFLANCLTDTIQTRKQKFYKGCIWDQLAFHFRFNPRRQCCVDH